MSIYITGDTHGNFDRFTKKKRSKLPFQLCDDDYIIVCGDLGLLWCHDKEYEYNLDWLSRLPFTLLWVTGNHENYDMVKEFDLEEWNGGLVRHIIRDKVILLERGQVFNIEGKTFFTFGGAESNDISDGILDRSDPEFESKKAMAKKNGGNYRILGESYWKEELPNQNEIITAFDNLDNVGNKVDYIISHCASLSMQNKININNHKKKNNILTNFFEALESELKYEHWYFGHYHLDQDIDDKHTVLYKKIIKIF